MTYYSPLTPLAMEKSEVLFFIFSGNHGFMDPGFDIASFENKYFSHN